MPANATSVARPAGTDSRPAILAAGRCLVSISAAHATDSTAVSPDSRTAHRPASLPASRPTCADHQATTARTATTMPVSVKNPGFTSLPQRGEEHLGRGSRHRLRQHDGHHARRAGHRVRSIATAYRQRRVDP